MKDPVQALLKLIYEILTEISKQLAALDRGVASLRNELAGAGKDSKRVADDQGGKLDQLIQNQDRNLGALGYRFLVALIGTVENAAKKNPFQLLTILIPLGPAVFSSLTLFMVIVLGGLYSLVYGDPPDVVLTRLKSVFFGD